MRSRPWLVVFVVACAGVVVATADLAADDAKKLEGTWVVESTSRDEFLAVGWKGDQWVFGGDRVTLKTKAKELNFTFTVDPAKEPKTMDFAPPKESNQARWLTIYELDGDLLKVCIGLGAKRPTEFSDKQGMVVVLKRKK